MFTHLFNAMRPINHRDPGVIVAAMNSRAATPALIADGVHVHPSIMRMVCETRGATRMIIVTDKVSLAGTSPGASHTVGRERAGIHEGAARLPDGTLAGAIISMLEGLRLMVTAVGVEVGEAALTAASNPAALIANGNERAPRGTLQPGAISDIIVLSPELVLKSVFIAGRELR